MAELIDIRETVRKRYADAASAAARGAYDDARALEAEAGCCGTEQSTCSPADETGVFGGALYDEARREGVPEAALNASLGCGVPTAVAELREGEMVLDLGSGAGADVLISARRVAPTGKAIGLDMTDEMLALARANAAEAGGRFAISDVIADPDMDEQTKVDMAAWTGCVAGALTETEFRATLQAAGFEQIEIHRTHQVHEHASSAIIRARKPGSTHRMAGDS
ncbi:MAG: methyltransferase domain-containing protein [Actinomycetota bacterium]|nr:methyltransferase domain-containing protein [Actinomycetota bacterium]